MTPTIRRAAWGLLLAGVALVAAEAAARVDDRIRLGVPLAHTPDYDRDLKYRDWFGVRGRPHGQYRRWHLNNHGFRGPDVAIQKPQDCTRIMAIGASETFGLYESDNHEYPAQLRDSLRPYGCYEVVNAAIVGAGIPSVVRLWEHYLFQFKPDLVLIYESPTAYLGNTDSRWGPVRGKVQPLPPLPPRPRLLEQISTLWETPDFIQRRRLEQWIAAEVQGKPESWFFHEAPSERLDLYVQDLDSLVKSIRAVGAIPIVITHAMRFSVPPLPNDEMLLLAARRFNERATTAGVLDMEVQGAARLRAYAARACIPLVDAASTMNGKHEYFGDGVHFTDRGASVMAALITRKVLALETRAAAGWAAADRSCIPQESSGLPEG